VKVKHTTGDFETSDGVKIFFQCWSPQGASGKPAHAVLTIVHGMAEHSDRYDFPIEYFTKLGFTVYAMDLRGHGSSGGRRAYADSFQQLLQDIRLFLKTVRKKEHGKKVFLIGHSFGGQLVLNYGARFPDDLAGIIVSSPNIRLQLKVPFIKRLFAPVVSRIFPTLTIGNELDATTISHDAEVVKRYREDKRVARKITTRLADITLGNQLEMMNLAARFHVPSLLMHAGDDRICSAEGTKDFFHKIPIQDKSLKIYDGFYHELFNEVGRDKVFKDMENWLEKRI
jgi:alpha-beta hydrolase superfamily lysophospholipase